MLMFLKNLRFYAEPFIHCQPAFRTCAKTLNQTVPTSFSVFVTHVSFYECVYKEIPSELTQYGKVHNVFLDFFFLIE